MELVQRQRGKADEAALCRVRDRLERRQAVVYPADSF